MNFNETADNNETYNYDYYNDTNDYNSYEYSDYYDSNYTVPDYYTAYSPDYTHQYNVANAIEASQPSTSHDQYQPDFYKDRSDPEPK